ncbi:MAG TPA: phosphoribosylamine--glycine ligase [Acidimicrobiales bacterium]
MTVCVIGAGGREHALARVLARSDDVVVTPGNPGMPATSPEGHRIVTTPAPPEEVPADLHVIGPETPLVDGMADRLRAAGLRVFGPGADGARLEGSKAFMKDVLARAGVPTARFGAFDRADDAISFLRSLPGPWVVKTDGLAAGKGVLVAPTLAEAEADVAAKLSGTAFGAAGRRVVIEEALAGEECSLLAICDGERAVALAPARDFKRIGDGDVGPNTGGMGSYSGLDELDGPAVDALMELAVAPVIHALRALGIEYRGVLYAGLMLTEDGPKVLEFNVRFGDPETQVVLPRLASDPVGLLASAADGHLGTEPTFTPDAAVCVVLAAAGYPAEVRTGDPIEGLGDDGQLAVPVTGTTVFHAGTASGAGGFRTAGGRVLGVSALGSDVAEARRRAYQGAGQLRWPGVQLRHDIADRAARRAGAAR